MASITFGNTGVGGASGGVAVTSGASGQSVFVVVNNTDTAINYAVTSNGAMSGVGFAGGHDEGEHTFTNVTAAGTVVSGKLNKRSYITFVGTTTAARTMAFVTGATTAHGTSVTNGQEMHLGRIG